jgi:hypothetical protein
MRFRDWKGGRQGLRIPKALATPVYAPRGSQHLKGGLSAHNHFNKARRPHRDGTGAEDSWKSWATGCRESES